MLPQPPEISTTAMSVALGKAATRAETNFSSPSDRASSRGPEVCRDRATEVCSDLSKKGLREPGIWDCSMGGLLKVNVGLLLLHCGRDAKDRLDILGSAGGRRLRTRQPNIPTVWICGDRMWECFCLVTVGHRSAQLSARSSGHQSTRPSWQTGSNPGILCLALLYCLTLE